MALAKKVNLGKEDELTLSLVGIVSTAKGMNWVEFTISFRKKWRVEWISCMNLDTSKSSMDWSKQKKTYFQCFLFLIFYLLVWFFKFLHCQKQFKGRLCYRIKRAENLESRKGNCSGNLLWCCRLNMMSYTQLLPLSLWFSSIVHIGGRFFFCFGNNSYSYWDIVY